MEGRAVGRYFRIEYEWDIVSTRSQLRELAREWGFDELDQSRIARSVSELLRNVVHHAEKGLLQVERIERDGKSGMLIIVQDLGPGIADVSELMKKVQTSQSVESSGLKQVHQLMDEFSIRTVEGRGTMVEAIKWLKPAGAAADS
jgi:serine/threonine-protein kinase RsbT